MVKFNFPKKVAFNLKLTEETFTRIQAIARREEVAEQEILEEFVRASIIEYWEIIDSTPNPTKPSFNPAHSQLEVTDLPKKLGRPKGSSKVQTFTAERICQRPKCGKVIPKPALMSIKAYSKRKFCDHQCKVLDSNDKLHDHEEEAAPFRNGSVNAQESKCQFVGCDNPDKVHYRSTMYKRTRGGESYYMCSFDCATGFEHENE